MCFDVRGGGGCGLELAITGINPFSDFLEGFSLQSTEVIISTLYTFSQLQRNCSGIFNLHPTNSPGGTTVILLDSGRT